MLRLTGRLVSPMLRLTGRLVSPMLRLTGRLVWKSRRAVTRAHLTRTVVGCVVWLSCMVFGGVAFRHLAGRTRIRNDYHPTSDRGISPAVSTMAVSAPATRAVLFSNVDCEYPSLFPPCRSISKKHGLQEETEEPVPANSVVANPALDESLIVDLGDQETILSIDANGMPCKTLRAAIWQR